ncbi:MAG: 16S rRNA (cytosine(967)-C(5))-methyltransferase RsmB [Lachnospiraceae bacterium]|nr:16S rRNA (cytosine(967)-C(5))-methyltransferase RsmB [Lachnospiraceae bacterium]
MTDETVRGLCLDCLLEILEKDRHSHVVLKNVLESHRDLVKRDRAFLTCLTEGTIEHLYELDYIIDCFSKTKTEKQKPVIRELLRMSVYQMKYMDTVPDRAAVNEAVRLAGKRGFASLKGFVNGVLRTIARELDRVSYPKREDGFSKWARVKYSMPIWITEELLGEYGEERTLQFLSQGLSGRPFTVRCNQSRAAEEAIVKSLTEQGLDVKTVPDVPGVLMLERFDRPEEIRAFQEGLLQVQDVSSVLAGLAAGIKPGDFVVETCAAPGGKSLHAADLLRGKGHVEARDLTMAKIALIKENIERSRFENISARVWDARLPDREMFGRADVVLADLPCSGLGIIGRKSDIKYKMTKEKQRELSTLQKEILDASWQYVKPGGRLVFSTCTVFPSENRENALWFAANYPFTTVDLREELPKRFFGKEEENKDGWLQLLPGEKGTDGFFIAAFRRNDEEDKNRKESEGSGTE